MTSDSTGLRPCLRCNRFRGSKKEVDDHEEHCQDYNEPYANYIDGLSARLFRGEEAESINRLSPKRRYEQQLYYLYCLRTRHDTDDFLTHMELAADRLEAQENSDLKVKMIKERQSRKKKEPLLSVSEGPGPDGVGDVEIDGFNRVLDERMAGQAAKEGMKKNKASKTPKKQTKCLLKHKPLKENIPALKTSHIETKAKTDSTEYNDKEEENISGKVSLNVSRNFLNETATDPKMKTENLDQRVAGSQAAKEANEKKKHSTKRQTT